MNILMNQMMCSRILDLLKIHEGVKLNPYTDTVGKLTIGIGRNLIDVGISKGEAEYLALNDISYHYEYLYKNYPWFKELDEVRQIALVDMQFNLGAVGFSKFKNMISALEKKNYAAAAFYALESKWADQVGKRAKDLSEMIRTAEYPLLKKLESL